MRSLILFSVLATSLFLSSQTEVGAPKPDQIIELFRHGARGPMHRYDDSWSDDQYEVLTAVGMRQQYILGKVLAEKYSHLIGSAYDYNKIYMISDDSPRCIQSAYAQLYGMYMGAGPSLRPNYPREVAVPPFQDPRVKQIADNLPNSQAIPNNFESTIVDIADSKSIYIFQGDDPILCPNMQKWDESNYNDTLSQEAWKIFSETIENTNKYLPKDRQLKTPSDITGFGDSLYVDWYDNRTLPGGIKDPVLFNNMTYAFTWFSFHIWEGKVIQRQIGAYNYVVEMLKQLENFRKGVDYKPVALYSSHDDNIHALLAAFDLMTEECIMENFRSYTAGQEIPHPECFYPFFASNVILEFYNSTNNPYVKLYYDNIELPLCGGKYSCPYDEFVAFAKNATGNNTFESYLEKCGVKESKVEAVDSIFPTTWMSLNSSLEKMSYLVEEKIDFELMAFAVMIFFVIFLSAKIAENKKKYEKLLEQSRSDYNFYNQIPEVETK